MPAEAGGPAMLGATGRVTMAGQADPSDPAGITVLSSHTVTGYKIRIR
jgi:hypothetical protein